MPKRLVPVFLLLATAALAGCSGDDNGDNSTARDTGSPQTSVAPTTCTYVQDGSQSGKQVNPPPSTPSVSGEVAATMATSVGDFKLTLDAERTPCTVNSFVSLAQQGYFDDTTCHRLTTQGILVLQCGDPTGTGSGGPGYSFADELSGNETYPAGTLAMANAGPNTNGSQFFIVYGETPLPAQYTVFGNVDDATVAAVKKVAAKGTDNANGSGDGAPVTPVDITSVTIG